MNFKAALVTGAGARIGREIALSLGRKGINVAVHYASSDKGAQKTVEKLGDLGVRAVAVQANLLDDAQILKLIPARAGCFGSETLTS